MLSSILLSIVTNLAGDGVIAISKKVYTEALMHGVIKARARNFGRFSLIEKLSYDEAEKAAKRIAGQIRKDRLNPSIIVGIGRGGAIFGSLISYNLGNTPILMLDRKYSWAEGDQRKDDFYFDISIPDEYLEQVFLVAGEIHTGKTMRMFYDHLKAKGAETIRCCAFYRQNYPAGKKVAIAADYYGVSGESQPLMPWQDADFIRDSLSARKGWTVPSKRLIIVRHGQTDLNVRDIFIGSRTEVPLSETGRAQAAAAGKEIKELLGKERVHICCSPQSRCQETARLVKAALGKKRADISEMPDLRERDFGSWEGMERTAIEAQDNTLYDAYVSGALDCTPEGAEPLQKVIARVEKARDEILSKDAENIIVVTHNTTGRLLICALTDTPYEKYRTVTLDNAAPYILESHFSFTPPRLATTKDSF